MVQRGMRIDGVYLKEVGPFKEAKLDFQPRQSGDKADLHIFVGPNGSGKSTILYAMAALLGGPNSRAGVGQAFARLHGEDSVIALTTGGGPVALAQKKRPDRNPLASPFGGPSLAAHADNGPHVWYTGSRSSNAAIIGCWNLFARHGHIRDSPDFAAFAYSGSRSLLHYHFSAIEEPTDGALVQSLSFDSTVDAKRLAQWLSATFAKRALAQEQRNSEDVERFGTSIERIEEAIAEVVGDPVKLAMIYNPSFRIIVERHGRTIDLDLLPDGLKSILSWVADLLMRLDRIPWQPETSPLERPFALLLDEIDVHLHPAWQRKVLPMVQKLFPKAQIFVTTHSPFVVSSVSDAWVYPLDVNEKGEATTLPPVKSQAGTSFRAVVKSIFGVEEEFDEETEAGFREFYALRERVLGGETDRFDELQALGIRLGSRGLEVRDIVTSEILRVARRLGRQS